MSAPKPRPTGPRALKASAEARKRMVMILETLSGVRTTQEAADGLGVALARYYQLETYALEGLLAALEPRARGRKVSAAQECEDLRAQIQRLEREVKRQQALYRTTQRALGVPKPASKRGVDAKGKPVRRRRNKKTRGERVLAELARGTDGAGPDVRPEATEPGGES
jgi:hypothetical protein